MKKILVPTDFSANADNALDFAILLAQQLSMKLVVVNVFEIPVPVAPISFNTLQEEISAERKSILNKLHGVCEKIKHAGNVESEYCALEGQTVDALLKYCELRSFEYVVMGTCGEGEHQPELFGSTTLRFIERSSIPVIAVPVDARFKNETRKITFATDYHSTDIEAIEKIKDIAAASRAQINVLHVSESSLPAEKQLLLLQKFMEKVQAAVNYNNMSFQLLPGENTAERLEQYIMKDNDADIVVISSQLRGLFPRLFGKKSLAKKIAGETKIPLIVFHHPKVEEPVLKINETENQ